MFFVWVTAASLGQGQVVECPRGVCVLTAFPWVWWCCLLPPRAHTPVTPPSEGPSLSYSYRFPNGGQSVSWEGRLGLCTCPASPHILPGGSGGSTSEVVCRPDHRGEWGLTPSFPLRIGGVSARTKCFTFPSIYLFAFQYVDPYSRVWVLFPHLAITLSQVCPFRLAPECSDVAPGLCDD